MPRKRAAKSPALLERRSDVDNDDFFFDDSQSNSGRSSVEPQHRNAANARERARMRVLSKAFCRLKTTLPWVPADTKLSKLDTLRLAASYIAHLRALLNDEPRSAQVFPHPLNLAWPFAFQHGGTLSCSISPRWNVAPPTTDLTPSDTRPEQRYIEYTDYKEYPEKGYDKEYEGNLDGNCQTHAHEQYCHYAYKESFYDKNGY